MDAAFGKVEKEMEILPSGFDQKALGRHWAYGCYNTCSEDDGRRCNDSFADNTIGAVYVFWKADG